MHVLSECRAAEGVIGGVTAATRQRGRVDQGSWRYNTLSFVSPNGHDLGIFFLVGCVFVFPLFVPRRGAHQTAANQPTTPTTDTDHSDYFDAQGHMFNHFGEANPRTINPPSQDELLLTSHCPPPHSSVDHHGRWPNDLGSLHSLPPRSAISEWDRTPATRSKNRSSSRAQSEPIRIRRKGRGASKQLDEGGA